MLYKAVKFEAKDLDVKKRTAVLAFATYNTEDRDKDIARKGMFTKSWTDHFDDIRFFRNHKKDEPMGVIDRFEEDDKHAYAVVKMGDWTIADDTLKMMDFGAVTNNSYGFDPIKVMGRKEKGRDFKEVKLWEISVLTHWGAHPESKVIEVNKEIDEELQMEIKELKDSIERMESFCHNTTASDEMITNILGEIENQKQLLLKYDGKADTQEGDDLTEPDARGNNDKAFVDELLLLTLKF